MVGERAQHRRPVKPPTAADQWRRRTYAQDLAAAEAAWAQVAAWAEVNGRDWRHLDQTGIIGLYRQYTVAAAGTPPIRWAGAA